MIGDARLYPMLVSIKISEDEIISTIDFALTVQHDFNTDQLSCTINASLDLFNKETVHKIAQRFHSMLEQLFIYRNKPIYELSLILPVDILLMQSLNNTQVLFPTSTCIHHEFIYQVMKHPQKLAVELDDQSLTYSELLYYAHVLSLNLLNAHEVIPGEIICQCVERCLSMVSWFFKVGIHLNKIIDICQVVGIMAIEMVGGVYCPLSPRDPQQRLHALVQQTQSRLVLVHWLTKTKFQNDTISIDIDSGLVDNDVKSNIDVDRLSSVIVTPDNIAYTIFTSGSTGMPKAVSNEELIVKLYYIIV